MARGGDPWDCPKGDFEAQNPMMKSIIAKSFTQLQNSNLGFFSARKKQTQPISLIDSTLDEELISYLRKTEEVNQMLP